MKFKFYVPVTSLSKSKPSTKLETKNGIIGKIRGIASTPDLDHEGEQVMQEGLDISNFLNKGFLNWDHDNSKIVGYPDKENTKITEEGLLVEGYLLDTEEGRRAWETSIALQKSDTDRRLGFSIEGQVLKQDKKGKILKARVTNVALTATPVNPYTSWNSLVKSMTADNNTAIIRESLENAKAYCQKGLDGDTEVLEHVGCLYERLNNSESCDDVKTYLMLFKGFYGDELEENLAEVMKVLEERKEE